MYSLKFTNLSKYAPSLVSNSRDEMSRFVRGVLDDLQEECHSAMLNDNMNIFDLMVHQKNVEEARARRKSRDAMMEGSFDGGSSKYKTSPSLRRGFKVKFLPSIQSPLVIGCLTLCLRSKKVPIHKQRSQLV